MSELPLPIGIWDAVRDRARLAPAAEAILSPGRRALRYDELSHFIGQTHEALEAHGLARGSRVALVAPNGPEAATAFLALADYGPFCPLNPAYREEEFLFYLEDLRPSAAVVQMDEGSPSKVIGAARRLGVPLIRLEAAAAEPAGVFALGADSAGPRPEGRSSDGDGTALLLHTSGTTSRPKLVPLTAANLAASADSVRRTLQLGPSDRCLNVMPLFHIHGLVAALLASLRAGGGVVCCPGFQAPRFFYWLKETGANWYTAAPAIHQSVLERAQDDDGTSIGRALRLLRSCSASLPPSVMNRLEDCFGAPVIEAYGMTEAAHQMASNPPPPAVRKAGTVGLPAGPELAILNEAGEPQEAGVTGEVAIRGANVTRGYLGNPEANEAAFVNGWFRTGDQGFFDEDGYLRLTGRIKELINRGGEKISPREIDEVLLRHPAVRQAVSFAVADSRLGERVAAAVVLDPAAGIVEERDLRRHAAASLADFKVPERVLILDEIPKGPTGKVQRIGLAEKLGCTSADPVRADESWSDPGAESGLTDEVRRLFAGVLGHSSSRADFFELGGDSVLATLLLARVSREFGADIPFLDFLENSTAAGLARLIERGGAYDKLSGEPPASVIEPRQEFAALVTIQRGSVASTVFCVPGSFGEAEGFARLAEALDGEWTVYLFRALADGDRFRQFSVDELADNLVAGIESRQPDGPCFLAGACFGGLVAYEAARRLRERGREIGGLILVDAYNQKWAKRESAASAWKLRLRYAAGRAWYHLSNLASLPSSEWRDYLAPRVEMFRRRSREERDMAAYRRAIAGEGEIPPALRQLRFASWEAARRYTPGLYDGPLTLIQVSEPREGGNACPYMGWDRVARGPVRKITVAGDHRSALREPAVRKVAECLSAVQEM